MRECVKGVGCERAVEMKTEGIAGAGACRHDWKWDSTVTKIEHRKLRLTWRTQTANDVD